MGPKEPVPSPATTTSLSEDAKILQALLPHLDKDSLPDSVRHLVLQKEQHAVQQDARHLHKLVRRRGEARKQLAALQEDRVAFETAWYKYAEELQQTLQAQFTAREQSLAEFDQRHREWSEQLFESSKELKEAARHGHKDTENSSSEDALSDQDMEAEVNKAAEVDAKAAARREEMVQSHQKLQEALQQVKQNAAAGATVRERTPRRGPKRSAESIVDLTNTDTEETPAKAAAGMVGTEPAKPPF